MAGPARATAPDGLVLDYRVLRDGFEIGRHKVAFRHDGDAVMTVETEIRISVSFLFITLYSYRLDARETWRGDRLVGLDSTTDDDGDLYAVSAVAEGDGLRVEAGRKKLDGPGDGGPVEPVAPRDGAGLAAHRRRAGRGHRGRL